MGAMGVTLLVLGLAACARWPAEPDAVTAGAVLELSKPLRIPAGELSRYFQHGEPTPYVAVDVYYPYCRLELRTLDDRARTLEPTEFRIRRVWFDEEYVQARRPVYAGPVLRLASAATAEVDSTHLELSSERYPDVRELVCEHWRDPTDSRHLRRAEIDEALGDWFRLSP